MRNIIIFSLLVILNQSSCAQTETGAKFNQNLVNQNRIEFYVFIGDSKVSGGVNTESGSWDPKYNTTGSKAQILYRDDRITGDESTLRFLEYDPHYNRFPGYAAPSSSPPYSVGYDNSFMWYMRTQSTRNTGLLKWALGGTTLMAVAGSMNDWNPGTNEMYRLLVVDYVNLAKGKAKEAGFYSGNIKAVFVSLGTNDCLTGIWNNAQFTADMADFVPALRRAFGKPNLPVYWQQVRSDLSSHPSGNYTVTAVTQCRAAISGYAAANGDANFTVLDYESTTSTSDGVHEDEQSCEEIGLDIASIFIGL